jgi:hypothetical protein
MATLVLNAPKYQAKIHGKQSYQNTLNSCIGIGYALSSRIRTSVAEGDEVLLLDKNSQKAAKGKIVRIEATGVFTENKIQRFNIHIGGFVGCEYVNVSLNRNGVAIIEI